MLDRENEKKPKEDKIIAEKNWHENTKYKVGKNWWKRY
jgi:hypothetical protein